MDYKFTGEWITDSEFSRLIPREVFHRQLEKVSLPCTEHRCRHILFRRKFVCDTLGANTVIKITADDHYKLYINGRFVAEGPSPSYHFSYNYNTIDIGAYLHTGENTVAVHTFYQGLINRVWQSGDLRHGLLLDIICDSRVILSSDESFKASPHTAYSELGVIGYDTQFLESYDLGAPEVGFERADFDDSRWENACICEHNDHITVPQKSKMLEYETIEPTSITRSEHGILYDFGSIYVGYLSVTVRGKKGDSIRIRCAQELCEDGSLRYRMRANCTYEEELILSDKVGSLDWFDYKSFRYAQLTLPEGAEILSVSLLARHYPFELRAHLKPELSAHDQIQRIWELCVNTQRYGVQEVIQDCMEREKGFYLGDGCYTALTNMILTEDDSMVRRLIDDAFLTDRITDTLVTCLNCSFMQEIAEYPMILIYLVLWHYRLTDDAEYLALNYPKVVKLLEAYRRRYESGYLLRDLDKWCVVEWPKNYQHGYDVDIREGQICKEAHVSINAYYIEAVRSANAMASLLGRQKYRDETPLINAFFKAFYNGKVALFRDGENTEHISLVGNSFVYGFDLCPDPVFKNSFLSMLEQHGISSLSLFCTFPVLQGLARNGRFDLIEKYLLEQGAWSRIMREGGRVTFEGWSKDSKWNTSLFHLTLSYAALFMTDIDLKRLFGAV